MRFFILESSRLRNQYLNELTEYEYYETREKPKQELEKEQDFQSEIDFAFFAVRLGWSYSQYLETTPVQRRFIRKELETYTVETSTLYEKALEVALANSMAKRGAKKEKLWKKNRKKQAPIISVVEMEKIQQQLNKRIPWTPWSRKGAVNG